MAGIRRTSAFWMVERWHPASSSFPQYDFAGPICGGSGIGTYDAVSGALTLSVNGGYAEFVVGTGTGVADLPDKERRRA